MGNFCQCAAQPEIKSDSPLRKHLDEPLAPDTMYDSIQTDIDWDVPSLQRSNTKPIEIKPNDDELSAQYSDLRKVSVQDFRFLKLLGKGSFGKVILVEKKDTGKLFAMKVLNKNEIEKRNQRFNTKSEREILQKANSPFVVQLHYAFQNPTKLYLVMDFMQGGELFFHLRRTDRFTEDRTRFYSAELVLSLEHLHSMGIIYRDLKPENILLDADGHIKLTDFGLSKAGITSGIKTNTFCGTPEYLAPEILQSLGHDCTADWWSLGALIYEMASGAPPFYSKDKRKMFADILEKPIEMKSHFSKELRALLNGLLVLQPGRRLQNAHEIKSQDFFKGIDWEKLARQELKPPFKPHVENNKDLKNFDKFFTDEHIKETPDAEKLAGSNVNSYYNFTYNPEAELRRADKTE